MISLSSSAWRLGLGREEVRVIQMGFVERSDVRALLSFGVFKPVDGGGSLG